MKEEALELADFLENNMVAAVAILGDVTATHIVSTLRQQAKRIEELKKQTKPLSDEEIEIMASAFIERATSTQRQECIKFARAIEERHGIK